MQIRNMHKPLRNWIEADLLWRLYLLLSERCIFGKCDKMNFKKWNIIIQYIANVIKKYLELFYYRVPEMKQDLVRLSSSHFKTDFILLCQIIRNEEFEHVKTFLLNYFFQVCVFLE